jgi:putative ABC transport system permease protein
MFKNHLKIALRNLLKHKAYSFINIAGLAIGMACCLLILLYIHNEIGYDRFHEKADRIHRLVVEYTIGDKTFENSLSSAPMAPALVQDYPEIEQAVRVHPHMVPNVLIRAGEKRFYEDKFFYADANVFAVFSFPLVKGDPQRALVEPFSVVVTEAMAQKYFGNDDPIGQTLLLENREPYKITGVLKNLPARSHLQFDFLASFATLAQTAGDRLAIWTYNPFYTYLLLPENYPPGELDKKIAGLVESRIGERLKPLGWKLRPHLQPLRDIHLHPLENDYGTQGDIRSVYLFSAIAFFVLLIGCVNFMNLATARSAMRAREVGMRKVVGAQPIQLVRQFLGEAVLLSLIALACAVALVELLLLAFNTLVGKQLALRQADGLLLFAGLAGIALFVGVVAGSYPAFFLSAFKPIEVVKGIVKPNRKGFTLRHGLVVFQFAVSVFLIIGTATVYHQLQFLQNKKLGFDKEHLMIVPLRDKAVLEKSEALKAGLLQNPAIMSAALTSRPPGMGASGTAVRHADAQNMMEMKYFFVDYNYLETLGIEMAAGRSFSREYASDAQGGIILNEQAARDLGWKSPEEALDQKLQLFGNREGTVIGVVKDFNFQPLRWGMQPVVMTINSERFEYLCIRLAPGDLREPVRFVEQIWGKFAPEIPFAFSFLDQDLDRLYYSEKRFGQTFGAFGLLAIVIACLGLFGLASFSAERRTKEIGIRKVLGATVSGLALLLSQEFTKLVLLSYLIAWPLAYFAMNKWLQDFAYHINLGWWVFALAGGLALLIALLTVSTQAIKAALANPVEALRYE